MPRPGHDAVLLITGLPSHYARRMTEQVLSAEPHAFIYAPVSAALRDRAVLALDELPEDQRERVVLIEGDPSAMDLGLSGAEFRQLTREVDRIHHVAHVGYAGGDKRGAHMANVVGAAEILEFSRAASQLSCLVFHSTAHVSGDRTGVVYEEDLTNGQAFRSDVEETRMRAERLVRRAMRDVPIAVVRPTTMVGEAIEGDRLDGLYLLVLLIVATPAEIAIPLPGRVDIPLNIVPLDFVVKAAHAIGRHPGAPGRTFHIADPRPLSARSVLDLVAHAGGRRTSRSHIPSNLAKALLRTPGLERFVRSPRAFVEQLTTPVRYDTRNADLVLRGTGIECPPFDSYVDQLVAVVQDHLKARQRRREVLDDDPDSEVDDPLS